jgi:glucokinase
MPIIGIDLGGTKLAAAVFTEEGAILDEETVPLGGMMGAEVGALIALRIQKLIESSRVKGNEIRSIGISVPGIYYPKMGTVWAPNIPGWGNYRLLDEVKRIAGVIPICIDSDRVCYILGESWKGVAQQCDNAIFIAVGTGIGAGILADGRVLRGANNIAGAIGWMALERPYRAEYAHCGCFEHRGSGEGIAKLARETILATTGYEGILKDKDPQTITAHDVFQAGEMGDPVATTILNQCIELWGMAIANLVSLFNPAIIIMGGGVFGPAVKLLPAIRAEAAKWAQPISMSQVSIEASGLGNRAGLFGAGLLALQNSKPH